MYIVLVGLSEFLFYCLSFFCCCFCFVGVGWDPTLLPYHISHVFFYKKSISIFTEIKKLQASL